ncbi:Ephrin type-B receptor 3 [Goodea atripinnis]|uniref:Ephrin type-B receptor 3 n=1 Tax=Goodea atripinnis TaxID=208336 RepID=A0ABV0MZA6_9TELE
MKLHVVQEWFGQSIDGSLDSACVLDECPIRGPSTLNSVCLIRKDRVRESPLRAWQLKRWTLRTASFGPPRNVISSVNETSLSLEWEEPEDTGGRGDLVYNVVCKKCLRDRSPCTRCDDNVDIAPRRLGMRQRKVVVRNLQAHTRYSFEVQAVNGVSGKNPSSPNYSTVNITTNQAGE